MTSQRILLLGGLLLFLSSIGYGLFYESVVLPAQHHSLLYNLDMALNMAAKGDIATASAFAGQYGAEEKSRVIQARIPLHLALTGAMTAGPLWLAPRLDISERMKLVLAMFVVGGGVLAAVGDFFRLAEPAGVGLYLLLGGYVWLALGLTGYLIYAALFAWLQEESPRPRRR